MTNHALGSSKPALCRQLLEWLVYNLSQHRPWTYDMYADFVLDKGIYPLSRQEFTWWMYYYDRKHLIDASGLWSVCRRNHTRYDGESVTWYDWEGNY